MFVCPFHTIQCSYKRLGVSSVYICVGINRRRIYDIINVFESLELAGKHSKNLYVWYGIEKLPITLAKLKAIAEFEGPLVFCDKPEVLSNPEFRWVGCTLVACNCAKL